ncbi:hypothetical protein GGI42DRAFT_341771 [Trichoderma sp. SZMC 28013]
MEVLGAITGVLGILPMAVDIVQWYKTTLSSVRNAGRDLASLIRDLDTEKVRLQTTCEVLLDGISSLPMIDGMAKDSFRALWKKHSPLLELRLGGSEQKIQGHILDMHKAASELEAKLWMYGDGSSKPANKRSIIRELRKNMSFTLNRGDYNNVLSRIKKGNSSLEELASNNRRLEPNRRKQSQARLIHFVRGLSKDVVQAIQTSITCECIASHRVCLELVTRDAVLTTSDKNDNVAQDWNFHVAFGSDDNAGINSTDYQDMSANGQLPNRWSNIYLRLGTFGFIRTAAIKPKPLPSRMDRCTVSTLREILEGKRQLSHPEKLKIAHAIAVNTLYLSNTPWVDECLTLDTIMFFLPSDDGDVDSILLDRPFVVKNFSTPPSQQSIPPRRPRSVDRAVFSVGALLIQLMIGKTENELEMTGPMNPRTIIAKRDAGRQLFDQLLESSGFNLKPAIEWCFNSVYHRMGGLQDDEYCQRFFEEVKSLPYAYKQLKAAGVTYNGPPVRSRTDSPEPDVGHRVRRPVRRPKRS